MSKRWATTIGGAVTFVAAGVGGVAASRIWDTPVWGWIWFIGALLVGAAATAWVTFRSADPTSAPDGGRRSPSHQGDNTIGSVNATQGGTAVGINYGDVRSSRPDSAP
jgi:membrane protein implicated in regulation of membrane protease activity